MCPHQFIFRRHAWVLSLRKTPTMKHDRVADSILDLIGDTPVVELRHVASPRGARVSMKLEQFSPTGASQDRLARALFQKLGLAHSPSTDVTVFLPTLGNTAVSLAMVCAMKKVKLVAVMPEHMSLERRQLLSAWGVKAELTPREGGYAGAVVRARQLAQATRGGLFFDASVEAPLFDAHEQTGRELLETIVADGGRLDAFVCGAGTGALLSGVARTLKKAFPEAKVILVTPSTLSPVHRLAGLGMQLETSVLDTSWVDLVETVSEESAWEMVSRLGREEGLLVGLSSAANVVAALRVAARLSPEGRVYTVAFDSGERDFSMADQFS